MSKLTIKFLINYDLDETYLFSSCDCWEMLYDILQEELRDYEDDQMEIKNYPFDHDWDGYKKIIMAIPTCSVKS